MKTLAVLALLILAARPAMATVGLAEWEIATPGGQRISHVDPLKARFGTCLRDPQRAGDAAVFVSHLEWWTFHPGYVVGKARSGFFLFHEPTRRVDVYPTEQLLSAEVGARHLGPPTSKRMTAEDGWREAWGPAYRQACDRLKVAGGAPAGVDATTHQKMKELCASVGSQ